MWTTGARACAARRARAAIRPVAPAFAVCVCSTSGRRCRISFRSARIAAASARSDSSRCSAGSLTTCDAELVGDVLHRLLARGERPRDDDDVVAAPPLLARELEDVERGAADVQPGDHVHDREAHAGSVPSASAAQTTPSVSQKIAASGEPPKSAAPASAPAERASHAAGTYACSAQARRVAAAAGDRAPRAASAASSRKNARADEARAGRAPGRTSVAG